MAINYTLLIDLGQGLSLVAGPPTITTWKTTERPQKPQRGTFGMNTQTNKLEYFDGQDWLEAPLTGA